MKTNAMTVQSEKGKNVIALSGNPNVGKSTVFNALSGMHQHTGNWAGKTVGNAVGKYTYNGREYTVVDLPGTYSLRAHSKEEEYANEFILSGEADITVIVCDATCLERNLTLALQISNVAKKAVLCVNLMDEAKKKGISIDFEKLSEKLGFPVVGITAHKKKDIVNLQRSIEFAADNEYKAECEYRGEIRSILEHNADEELSDRITLSIVRKAEKIACECVKTSNKRSLSDIKLDKIFTSKITGIPIMLLLVMLVFWITISGANYPSQMLSAMFFKAEDYLSAFLNYIGASPWIIDLVVCGLFRVLGWVVSVMLPPMAIFFPLFTLLEDFGYLPRIAFNLDHCFRRADTCGKQALTMCMGFGCNAVGIIGARIIDSPRERLIAIITNVFVPCNGRFPTLIAIITMFFVGASNGFSKSVLSSVLLTAVIVFSIFMTFLISKLLSKTILKGVPSSFTLELPPYRKPQILKVIFRSITDRTLFVLGRAVSVAAPAGIVIWLLANITVGDNSLLSICSDFLDPFAQLFGMDGKILMAFILGFPANEIVLPLIIMSYLSQSSIEELTALSDIRMILVENGWTVVTAVCVMLFSLMHWPCSTSLLTIKKETKSLKWTAVSFIVPTIAGFAVCFIFNFFATLVTM